MNQIPITVRGAKNLREELRFLTKEERPRLTQAIAIAREHGDLKENADYHAAREQQALVEARIAKIEGRLAAARIVDISRIPEGGTVIFGATVTMVNLQTEQIVSYQIVCDEEADVEEARISFQTPLAKAILGNKVDDVVEVQAPAGAIEYLIQQIKHI